MEIDYSSAGLWALLAATFFLAVTHTINPDHWFPFVMVGRANKWRISWVLGLATLAGIGHVGTSVFIGLFGVFAEKGASKEIANFLENATPILLMIFGFTYAAYALYQQRVGAHGHSHGIPIINKWLGIDPHAYDLPGHEHSHSRDRGLHLGKIELYLHNMELHIAIAHDDHLHDYDATKDKDHDHEHDHGEVLHDHLHHHQVSDINMRTHEEHDHTYDTQNHSHGERGHTHNEHNHGHPHSNHERTHSNHDHGHTHDHHQHGKPKANLRNKKAGWGLVMILGLTPCIALLPLTFAAVKYGTLAIILVNVMFAVATIGTILLFTWLGLMGLSWIKLEFFDEYGDIITGLIIGMVGAATKVFGL